MTPLTLAVVAVGCGLVALVAGALEGAGQVMAHGVSPTARHRPRTLVLVWGREPWGQQKGGEGGKWGFRGSPLGWEPMNPRLHGVGIGVRLHPNPIVRSHSSPTPWNGYWGPHWSGPIEPQNHGMGIGVLIGVIPLNPNPMEWALGSPLE